MEASLPDLFKIAQLKKTYGFTLFVDECHSVMALASDGSGIYRYFLNKGYIFPDPIDMRSFALGKGFGSIGGAVGASEAFREGLEARWTSLVKNGMDPIPLPCVAGIIFQQQCKPLHGEVLRGLAQKAIYMRAELKRCGFTVLGQSDTPVLILFTGQVLITDKFARLSREEGLLVAPVG